MIGGLQLGAQMLPVEFTEQVSGRWSPDCSPGPAEPQEQRPEGCTGSSLAPAPPQPGLPVAPPAPGDPSGPLLLRRLCENWLIASGELCPSGGTLFILQKQVGRCPEKLLPAQQRCFFMHPDVRTCGS